MAKDFSFPFYVNNWIGGVIYFTFEEKGSYLDLLLLQFNNGKLTEKQIKHVLNTSYSNVWETIKCKFEFDGTFYWNAKMEEVKEERKAFTESRRNNRLGKTKKTTSEKHVLNIRKTYEKRMEGESKDDSIDKQEIDILTFDAFRKKFLGTKLGNETEFNNFKKHKDWEIVLPTLLPIIEKQILAKQQKIKLGQFVPEWKNLKTWINQRCWEEEMNIEATGEMSEKTLAEKNAAANEFYGR